MIRIVTITWRLQPIDEPDTQLVNQQGCPIACCILESWAPYCFLQMNSASCIRPPWTTAALDLMGIYGSRSCKLSAKNTNPQKCRQLECDRASHLWGPLHTPSRPRRTCSDSRIIKSVVSHPRSHTEVLLNKGATLPTQFSPAIFRGAVFREGSLCRHGL